MAFLRSLTILILILTQFQCTVVFHQAGNAIGSPIEKLRQYMHTPQKECNMGNSEMYVATESIQYHIAIIGRFIGLLIDAGIAFTYGGTTPLNGFKVLGSVLYFYGATLYNTIHIPNDYIYAGGNQYKDGWIDSPYSNCKNSSDFFVTYFNKEKSPKFLCEDFIHDESQRFLSKFTSINKIDPSKSESVHSMIGEPILVNLTERGVCKGYFFIEYPGGKKTLDIRL